MTTIAFDGTVLATDSQVNSEGMVFGNKTKILVINDGSRIACASNMDMAYILQSWMNGGEKPTPDTIESYDCIQVMPNGEAFEISGKYLHRVPACLPWAGGSGQTVALVAMRLGKNAIEAVALGIEFDNLSGGPINTWKP